MAKWFRAWATLAMMKLWRWEVMSLNSDRGTDHNLILNGESDLFVRFTWCDQYTTPI